MLVEEDTDGHDMTTQEFEGYPISDDDSDVPFEEIPNLVECITRVVVPELLNMDAALVRSSAVEANVTMTETFDGSSKRRKIIRGPEVLSIFKGTLQLQLPDHKMIECMPGDQGACWVTTILRSACVTRLAHCDFPSVFDLDKSEWRRQQKQLVCT